MSRRDEFALGACVLIAMFMLAGTVRGQVTYYVDG